MKLSHRVRLYPNATMKRVLDSLCDYRRYCWNRAVACWNEQYEVRSIGLSKDLLDKLIHKTENLTDEDKALVNQYPSPSHYNVRNELVANKEDWQYAFSSRVLQLAVKDVASAWNLFLNNRDTVGRPTFKTRKEPKQGFKTDRARIQNGRLLLDKPQEYRGEWKTIRFKGSDIQIVWYIKYALGAYSINPPNLFCMLTRRGGHMTALFVYLCRSCISTNCMVL